MIVVGGGLAGLCCALRLSERGIPCVIVEAQDEVGGRVRTDRVEGFLFDRGFQVLLTAYPEARRVLDYERLELRAFNSGALVRRGGKFNPLFHPGRHPDWGATTAFSPLLGVRDKLHAAGLWASVKSHGAEELLVTGPERTTEEELGARGFSAQAVASFFGPFFGGVFLQPRLTTSSRFFRFVFRMFADGPAAVPNHGMGMIPRQLASRVEAAGVSIRLRARVGSIDAKGVTLATGERIDGRAVVVAAELPEARRLIGEELGSGAGASRTACTLYFAAEQPVVKEPTLVLNGEGPGDGPVNHLAEISTTAPGYAPAGATLISASVLDARGASGAELEAAVRRQLSGWFGAGVNKWRHLRTYQIFDALPPLDPPTMQTPQRAVRIREGVYVCGDHRDNASIQGAMVSGRRAGEAV